MTILVFSCNGVKFLFCNVTLISLLEGGKA